MKNNYNTNEIQAMEIIADRAKNNYDHTLSLLENTDLNLSVKEYEAFIAKLIKDGYIESYTFKRKDCIAWPKISQELISIISISE